MEERELLLERLELALDRIREIPGEDWQEESLQHWKEYFTAVAKFLLLIEDTRQFLEQGKQNTATLEELKQRNHALYEDILPENYENSFANPAVAVKCLGEEFGALAAFLTQWKAMYDAGALINESGSADMFIAGDLVMMTNSSSNVAPVLEKVNGAFEVGVGKYLRVSAGASVASTGVSVGASVAAGVSAGAAPHAASERSIASASSRERSLAFFIVFSSQNYFLSVYGDDAGLNIENVPDHFAREYALVSGVAHRAVPEQEKLIAQAQRLVEIVQRAQNGDAALPRRLFRLVDDELFVCDIEIAGRLIENEQTRLLHERAGDGDLLLLAAGELLRAAVGERFKMHLGENVLSGLDILAPRLHAEAGDPPEQDRVEHAQRAEMDVLRHISDELCPLAPRHFQKIPAVKAD